MGENTLQENGVYDISSLTDRLPADVRLEAFEPAYCGWLAGWLDDRETVGLWSGNAYSSLDEAQLMRVLYDGEVLLPLRCRYLAVESVIEEPWATSSYLRSGRNCRCASAACQSASGVRVAAAFGSRSACGDSKPRLATTAPFVSTWRCCRRMQQRHAAIRNVASFMTPSGSRRLSRHRAPLIWTG